MSEKMRVHILAKELGVKSKDIVVKCQAEGLDVKNHMSTLSAGLEATIREWFSEGAHVTTIEVAERVNLEKLRTKRRPRKAARPRRTGREQTEAEAGAGLAVAEAPPPTAEEAPPAAEPAAPAEPAVTPPGKEPKLEPAVGELAETAAVAGQATIPAAESPPEVADEEAVAAAAEAPSAEQAPAEAPPGTEAPLRGTEAPPELEPPEAEPVMPAGPKNIPAPAQLMGPQVVRVEAAEPIRRPRRQPPTRPPARAPEIPVPAPASPPAIPGKRERGKGIRPGAEEEERRRRARHRVHPRRTARGSDAGERLREWRDRDLIERQERLDAASGRGIHARRAVEARPAAPRPVVPTKKVKAHVTEPIVVKDFCAAIGEPFSSVFPKLAEHGAIARINDRINVETAEFIAIEFGVELEVTRAQSALDRLKEEFGARQREELAPRPPVVTFLGHVDHGKTSLLDAIRNTRVVEGEFGGITQHIGAYRLNRDGLSVTFLDTPGHEAFTAMRARGATMTDVAVLVVAADDGVMPQTVEAINHAKAAGVPIVVALNKVDLPSLDLNKVYGQLAEQDLVPQQWGGDTDVIHTSAVTGEGINELIAHLATLSELLELRADPTVPSSGVVIEAEMQEGVGVVARLLAQDGTLHSGDVLVCGPGYGRVRAMRDDRGQLLEEAGPGTPVEVSGLDKLPDAGDRFYDVGNLQRAKEVAEEVRQERREASLIQTQRPRSLEELIGQREAGAVPELNIILRADVQGSVDVLKSALGEVPTTEVKLNILHTGVGAITEGDVLLAEASNGIIVGFHVVPESSARRLAEAKGIDIRLYRVIYSLTDEIRAALEGMLAPAIREETRGRAEVREVFNISRVGAIAGCYVTEGMISRSHYVRVIRDGRIILPSEDDVQHGRHREVASLRRFKDDVREVRAGLECGIKIAGFDDVKTEDLIEAYEVVEVARRL